VRPNSIHHLFFNSAFLFLIGFSCQAEELQTSAQQQALHVVRYFLSRLDSEDSKKYVHHLIILYEETTINIYNNFIFIPLSL
jgi:hypothetical protein